MDIERTPHLLMHIKKNSLQRAKGRDVLRLAHFVGMVTFGRTMEDIIEELHIRINYAHLGC
jgi:hypothetical protein